MFDTPALGIPHTKPSRTMLHRLIIRASAKYKPSEPMELFRPVVEMREGKVKEEVSYDEGLNTLTSMEGSSIRISHGDISGEARPGEHHGVDPG